ncbi:DUF3616 domain-containing protein [Segnochrobactraceae bacterium EtOH-i3]
MLRDRMTMSCGLLVALVLCLPAGIVRAAEPQVWSVQGQLAGEMKKDGSGPKVSRDISGIACIETDTFPRHCLVIDDEGQAAQSVTLGNGTLTAGVLVPVITDTYQRPNGPKALELDGEGVAFADGAFYVIGSHGHPRKSDLPADETDARIKAASQIIRLPAPGPDRFGRPEISRALPGILEKVPALAPFAGTRLQANGLTIEGVAVRGDRMLIGLRAPVLDGTRAPVLSVALAGLFGPDTGKVDKADPKLFALPLGADRGVRDLAPWGTGVLVLAGPSGDTGDAFAVYVWDGASNDARLLAELPAALTAGGLKPEALLPLEQTGADLKVLILSDSGKNGAPVAVTLPAP